jgi:sialate O-acetylesterase
LFWLMLSLGAWARGEVSLPAVFADNMVLQRERPVPIWGRAEPGEHVEIIYSKNHREVVADGSGHWRATLDPLPASSVPAALIVRGRNVITLQNVVVGDVWLCSGQSNMAKPVGAQSGQKPVSNYKEELRTADHPRLRFFKVPRAHAEKPSETLGGSWLVCTPQSLEQSKFSAVGYFFGREIERSVDIPIGLIDATYGATRIEAWTPPSGFASVPALADLAVATRTPGARAEDIVPSTLYYGMIHPLVPFALRGFLWYQGENNLYDVVDGARYTDKMEALIRGWRGEWGDAHLPFYYVQLAPFLYHVVHPHRIVSPTLLPEFWEAQTRALRIPDTGMVVTTDLVDDLFDIHPTRKQEVGQRLAYLALAHTYGRHDIADSGPTYRSMDISGGKVTVYFDHVGDRLVSRDEKPLTWFTIAGADGKFFPAQAEIHQDHVVLSSPDVAAPVMVRFAWDEAARPNLFNSAGLPARPFRASLASKSQQER